jgi:hypothetical protein
LHLFAGGEDLPGNFMAELNFCTMISGNVKFFIDYSHPENPKRRLFYLAFT